jgi:parallel beta-helix repeat protein
MRNMLIAAIGVAAFATTSLGADLRVGAGQPYSKIQDAVNAAKAGDRILVAKGVYAENVTASLDGLQFIGAKGAVWDGHIGADAGVCLAGSAKNLVVQGFAFRNGGTQVAITGDGGRILKCTSSGASAYAFRIDGNGARVESCSFVGPAGQAVVVYGNNATVRKNRVDGAANDGIYVSGSDAVVDGNTVRNTSGTSIQIYGDGAKATKNVCSVADGEGLDVSGADAFVQANRVSNVSGYGLDVSGARAKVMSNRVLDSVSTGIYVSGDALTVKANRVDVTVDDADGFNIYSGQSGGGVVENNVVNDAHQNGFYLGTKNVTIRNNKATRCGSEDEVGFSVSGDDNKLTGNVAKDGDAYGFMVSGSRNAVTACTATGNTRHGFYVTGGADNAFTSCTATGNDGDGFQNVAATTDLVGGTFKGNRVDVTNAGSFDVFQGVKLGSGGKDVAPDF